YRSASENHGEGSASPVLVHRGAKAWYRLLHALARLRFTGDLQSRGADAQHPLPRVGERDAADHQVRAPRGRSGRRAGFAHERLPDFTLDDRHLAATAAIDVALESLPGDEDA